MDEGYVFFPEITDKKEREALGKIITIETIKTMIKAGIDEKFIYAYQQTGRLIGETNAKLVSSKDMEEWNNAVDEYGEIIKKVKKSGKS